MIAYPPPEAERRIAPHRPTLVVAHRQPIGRHVEHIAVRNDDRVRAIGTHETT